MESVKLFIRPETIMHMLDLIITRTDDMFFSLPVTVSEPGIIADYFAIHVQIYVKKPEFRKKKIIIQKV